MTNRRRMFLQSVAASTLKPAMDMEKMQTPPMLKEKKGSMKCGAEHRQENKGKCGHAH